MGKGSEIQWCHHTFNCVWGCTEKFDAIDGERRMAPACQNCYARAFAKRTGHDVWGADKPRRVFGEKHWCEPLAWNVAAAKAGERHRVFCSSMADVFEDHPTVAQERERLWPLIAATPHLDWLLLTKRPENMVKMAPAAWAKAWPSNVWAGTTVETQAHAEIRIPHLLKAPAVVRFLSIEPMLGAIDLDPPTCQYCGRHEYDDDTEGDAQPWCTECDSEMCFGAWLDPCADRKQAGINWVIVGGESGPKARPLDLDAARSVVAQCRQAGIAPFVKQLGKRWARESGTWAHDSHGGTPDLWPEDLRVRQFPRVEHA